jgi:hypothetical protein
MSALILASSSPYVAFADADGSFSIPDVLPGSYVAKAYGGGQTVERQVDISGGTTEINFLKP